MEIDDVIEILAATIIIAFGVVILAQLYAPEIGSIMLDFLPEVIRGLFYLAMIFIFVVAAKDLMEALK